MDKHLHIISLNVPYPVNYGGVFDLFYKLPALQQQGVKIHLHCFDYGRGRQPELDKYCESVDYYDRRLGWKGLSLRYPYIVSSRRNEHLMERLLQDDFPVFMDGLHCTALLNDKRFAARPKFVRLHNIEYIYYKHLSRLVPSVFKKAYFAIESHLLHKYEASITRKATFWSVTEKDAELFRGMGCRTIDNLPLFLPPWDVKVQQGLGSFCLYQGDLSVPENEKAVRWLLQHVFNDIDIPFVVAGKNPSPQLEQLAKRRNTNCLIGNPSHAEMQDLISKAQVNIIPSYNDTGIKLKLLNALFNGRHCLVNMATVEGTGLEDACNVAETPEDFKRAIEYLFFKPMDESETHLRHRLLEPMFDNGRNARQMVKWIWNE